ncbi:hypothetical protein HBH98_101760 [Parastagonospora nodorum]|nr:hypothetical protein HBH51_065600 [Parastagonospora nodorum]KAH4347071.1 hypothetical protein HBH98_101760 [Parastagonospora nodorum]KAH4382395.1 hypothetical protein HBH97_084870 [Parastagonospora nodorum]KAH4398162.1 hypothetical protein HBH99_114700 [Parastagonospora nodorum]KAH4968616.1 hypothetical protein HBI78_056060 [Parastagonospora nodorum]
MQFTTIALALSSYGLTLGAAVDSLTVTPGIAIHVPGTPVATTLNISQVAGPVERSVEKRGNGNFYVCTDKNFGGICQNLAFTTDVCCKHAMFRIPCSRPVANTCIDTLASPFQDSISSAGPDSYACSVYQDSGCNGNNILITKPGINNLADFNFNDIISSYRCHI